MKTVIAIDGPAASGKSTIARHLAEEFAFGWVNSGAFYRALTWFLLREAGPECDADAASAVLARIALHGEFRGDEAVLTLDGIDPRPYLRDPEVNRFVSPFSQLDVVRDRLNAGFRELAGMRDCVVEGRDIGSCVFPGTPHKFFIDASPEVRRKRRSADGEIDEIAERDRLDAGRARAPLVAAPDAMVIDTTELSVEEVLEVLRRKLAAGGVIAAKTSP